MNQFKIVIPKRGEERKDAPDAGKGGTENPQGIGTKAERTEN